MSSADPSSKPESESTWRLTSAMPCLPVTDLEQAIHFYTRLGFSLDWRYPEGGDSTHAGMKLHDVSLLLNHCSGTPQRQDIYFFVADIMSFHRQLKTQFSEIPDLVEAEYGMTDFTLLDPWGHQLSFGESQ